MLAMTITETGVITLDDVTPNLAWLQAQVEGLIEPVTLRTDVTMYVNEEGKFNACGRNTSATILAQHFGAIWRDDWVSGPVAVVGFDPAEGEHIDLEREFAAQACRVACGMLPHTPVQVAPTYWQAAAEAVFDGVPVIALGDPLSTCAHRWDAGRCIRCLTPEPADAS